MVGEMANIYTNDMRGAARKNLKGMRESGIRRTRSCWWSGEAVAAQGTRVFKFRSRQMVMRAVPRFAEGYMLAKRGARLPDGLGFWIECTRGCEEWHVQTCTYGLFLPDCLEISNLVAEISSRSGGYVTW